MFFYLFFLCFWPLQHLFLLFILALPRSWNADKMLCAIYRDGTVYCQSSRSSHTGLFDPQWSSSQYARSDEFPYRRDDSPHGFFSSPLKREWALLCPCRVDTVILSALNLAWLCWDQGSFLYFTWTHCEKMVFTIQRPLLVNSGILKKMSP